MARNSPRGLSHNRHEGGVRAKAVAVTKLRRSRARPFAS